jgi:predicted deacylase
MIKMPITLTPVSLGNTSVDIPLARIQGESGGPTLLVTAGNDGDEYAGIAACYRIIEEFSSTRFCGTLIVVPIVNIPGFEAEKSENPMDGKFPKYIYPGNKLGSATERLRFWLSEIAESSDFWMDLHGGSLVEA